MLMLSLHTECTNSMIVASEEQGKGSHLRVTCVSVCNWDQLKTSNQRSFHELIKGSRWNL